MNRYSLIYCTAANSTEAEKIADTLVSKRLVACVNYLPISSVYRWKGVVEHESEILLLAKTESENFEKIKTEILAIHSYECPAITMLPIKQGSETFLSWISDSLNPR